MCVCAVLGPLRRLILYGRNDKREGEAYCAILFYRPIHNKAVQAAIQSEATVVVLYFLRRVLRPDAAAGCSP